MKILITGGSGFIGSYLVDELLKFKTYEIINMDVSKPVVEYQIPCWRFVNILDKKAVLGIFAQFQPNYVIHLAARTDTDPNSKLEDYLSNTDGTKNVLEAIGGCTSIQRVIIASTQFVHQRSGIPKNDEDFAPHTIYGESKVITEKLTRQANLHCCWTIIRPTNIWGPRHPRYINEFWRILKLGRYVHPGKQPVIRSYGFVGNVVDQIIQILLKEPGKVNGQVLYVGEDAINLYDWVNGFSLALRGRKVLTVPRFFVKCLALVGDVLSILKLKFPITSSRYKSMTEHNPVPMEKTFNILGKPKYSLQQGIDETADWLKNLNGFWHNENG